MSAVRELSVSEYRAFRLARLVSAEQMPYFMRALFAAQPVAAPGLGTFAVDARWRLYLDPALLVGEQAWPVPVAGAVLLHEVGHLLRAHAPRAKDLPQPVEHVRWNYAADAEINDDLLAAGVGLPDGVITPHMLGCSDGGIAEDYYAAICDPGGMPPIPEPDDGDPGCGSGAGCPSVPGELGSGAAAAGVVDGLDEAEADLVRRHVAQAVREAGTGKGRGSAPAGLARWAAGVLAPPTVPWDRLLRAVIRRAVADAAGRTNYSYARPPRRVVPGMVTPVLRGPSVTVSIVIDTSGSMSAGDLDAAMSELAGVLRTSGVARERVRLLSCDAASSSAQPVRSVADVELVGGGGTDMRVGIDAANDARPVPHVVIVLTDGDTPWPERPSRAHLVCAVIGGGDRQLEATPAWASTVHVPVGAGSGRAR